MRSHSTELTCIHHLLHVAATQCAAGSRKRKHDPERSVSEHKHHLVQAGVGSTGTRTPNTQHTKAQATAWALMHCSQQRPLPEATQVAGVVVILRHKISEQALDSIVDDQVRGLALEAQVLQQGAGGLAGG